MEFSEAFTPVDEAWGIFHDNYDNLLDQREELDAPETAGSLEELVAELEDILDDLDGLPTDEATDSILEDLTKAAEDELAELETLLAAYQDKAEEKEEAATEKAKEEAGSEDGAKEAEKSDTGDGEKSENQSPADGGEKLDVADVKEALDLPDAPEAAGDSKEPEGENDSALFEAMSEQVDDSNQVRKKSRRALEKLAEGLSEEDKASLVAFTAAFNRLTRNWDSFHDGYDDWVLTEGGCDQAAAAADLNRFGQQFGQLAAQVRGLSQASYLRPASDLLTEAADREEAALRTLRNTWAPYRNDVYRGLDQERANGDTLRRQAGRRTQELLERNGISQ